MANKRPYRPYQVSRQERLAFPLRDDKAKIRVVTAWRRYRNSALATHELLLQDFRVENPRDTKEISINERLQGFSTTRRP